MAITYLSGGRTQGVLGSAVPASTGWTIPSGFTLTSGTGMISSTTSNDHAVYDLGASAAIDTDDDFVCDFTLTRNSGDYHDHPMIRFKSTNTGYGLAANNGDNEILVLYWSGGDTGDSSGNANTAIIYRAGGTLYEKNTAATGYTQNVGTTLYYRYYMSKSGDAARTTRQSAWTTDANRTAEGSTGREFDVAAYNGALGSGWDASDPLRYLLIINHNGNQASWTISDFKFWNGVQSTGVSGNMASRTPTLALTFTDTPATSNLPENTIFEQTNDYKYFFLQSGVWVEE